MTVQSENERNKALVDEYFKAGPGVPTFRRVVKRKPEGPIIHGPTAVLIVISDVSLR
jgi:hypothetical protein